MKAYPSSISGFSDLGYLYDPDHYSWLDRHVLNSRVKREIREAMKSGSMIAAANEQVAEELHRYYRVPRENITVL